VEEKEQEEVATVSLAEENTQKERQKFLSAKKSIQGGNQKEFLIQPQCTEPVKVTPLPLITSCVSDLREGVVLYVLPMDTCQSTGARHFIKGAKHQGGPKVCPFKLGVQRHALTAMLFTITVWDPGIGVKVFVDHLGDLRTNPFDEGKFDAWGSPSQCPKINQGSGSQEQGLLQVKRS